MRVACAAFTQGGLELAARAARALRDRGDAVEVFATDRLASAVGTKPLGKLHAWTRRAFEDCDAVVFVSACGIAVRAIAPLVRDKLCDPAVVCVDERGTFAVSLLSGHAGGANELARRIAAACGGLAVVSTATDVRGVFAVDEWARTHGLAVMDRDEAKRISATLLEGGCVGFASDYDVAGAMPEGITGSHDTHELGFSVSLDPSRRPFAHTLRLVPRTVTVGVGCRRGTSAQDILALVDACLAEACLAHEGVCTLASIDVKADEEGLRAAASQRGWELRFHTANELAAVPGEFASSTFVQRTVGVDNVCERAACACGEELLLAKRSATGVTVALAARRPRLAWPSHDPAPAVQAAVNAAPGSPAHRDAGPCVSCVGLGPGGGADLTARAHEALASAEVIVGYTTYVQLIRDAYPQAEYVTTGMRGEVERCRKALELAAAGRRVAVVCSGDPGVYGMAGLLHELQAQYPGVAVEVVPGVTAANGGAAVLGAPLMHDWCSISLSDLMTPWETIVRRLRAAAEADFCIVLYNPSSHGRRDYLRRACDVLLASKDPSTVCGLVRNIGREGQTSVTLTLGELRDASVDMLTCVFVGNSQTRAMDGRMVTPRGYAVERPASKAEREERQPQDMPGERLPRPEVLVFGGTTEGRLLVEWLSRRDTCDVTVCTATEYGADLVHPGDHVKVSVGPLSAQDKRQLMEEHRFACIVDATHPYAQHISRSIDELASAHGLEVVRVVRNEEGEAAVAGDACVHVRDACDAARHMQGIAGNVLLTTGTKDLATYVGAIPDANERLYVRVLPVAASVDAAKRAGIPVSHIVAMQGPFSAALNRAIIEELGIRCMVTKESGDAGGFAQKVQAARESGIELVVIDRPQVEGVSLNQAKRLLEARYGL